MAEATGKPDRLLLVAEQEGLVVGFHYGLLREATPLMAPRLGGYITDVVVSERDAGAGVGSALLTAAEQSFAAHGAEDVTMTVAVHNRRGREFWLKHGFEP
jgi:ribosomal protein S18 acetylase RimI-like enzyme